MSVAADIALVTRRYRMPADDAALRRRLDRLTETVVRERLPQVLAEQGIAGDETVCIAEVALQLEFRAGMTDAACLEAWTAALAARVADCVASRDGAALFRARSRIAGWLDVPDALAAGRLEQAWAWRRLGFTRGDHRTPPARLLAQWCEAVAQAEDLPAVACALAHALALPRLIRQGLVRPAALSDLACAVLARMPSGVEALTGGPAPEAADGGRAVTAAKTGRDAAEVAPPAHVGSGPLTSPSRQVADSGARGGARRLLARSRLARILSGHAQADAGAARALASWVLFEVEPGRVAMPAADLRALLDDLAEALEIGPVAVSGSDGAAARDAAGEGGPAVASATLSGGDGPLGANGEAGSAARGDLRPGDGSAVARPTRDPAVAQAPGIAPNRRDEAGPQYSRFGGLVLWINAMELFATYRGLRADPALAGCSGAALIERFVLAALPGIALDDPSVALLSARSPGAPPASPQEPPPNAAADAAMAAHVDRFRGGLAALLPERDPERLLSDLARRRARIERSPGWATVALPLACVETDLRAAGLDLHPDFVPWIGMVIRIAYEAAP